MKLKGRISHQGGLEGIRAVDWTRAARRISVAGRSGRPVVWRVIKLRSSRLSVRRLLLLLVWELHGDILL
jgi:hypothetical protein